MCCVQTSTHSCPPRAGDRKLGLAAVGTRAAWRRETGLAEAHGKVLVIDDDQDMRWAIRTILAQSGFTIAEAAAGPPGLQLASHTAPDAVLLDIEMPGMRGEEVLRRLRHQHKDVPVIILTAFGTIPGGIEAIRTGAFEYITKPFHNEWLVDVVRRAVLRHRAAPPQAACGVRAVITATMGSSPAIQSLVDQIEAVIATDYSVLIRGETGAGKEVVARCLHEKGPRARRPLAVVDCGSIVEGLTDSAFFGHEKGAFTGAVGRRCGWFEMAAGGTVFLDEIGNLSPPGQKALLRVLEERVIYRVGSTAPIHLDVRVVAATNEPLEERTRIAAFREDLFFRLAEYIISVPPLRERREDIDFLARRFLDEACASLGRPSGDIAPTALDLLNSYDWPGNVRELRNVVRRAALTCPGTISVSQIGGCLGGHTAPPSPKPHAAHAIPLRSHVRDKVREVERRAIFDALDRARGNKAAAARLLGIDYKTYRTKLNALRTHSVANANVAC